jgi:hypothetical protein
MFYAALKRRSSTSVQALIVTAGVRCRCAPWLASTGNKKRGPVRGRVRLFDYKFIISCGNGVIGSGLAGIYLLLVHGGRLDRVVSAY